MVLVEIDEEFKAISIDNLREDSWRFCINGLSEWRLLEILYQQTVWVENWWGFFINGLSGWKIDVDFVSTDCLSGKCWSFGVNELSGRILMDFYQRNIWVDMDGGFVSTDYLMDRGFVSTNCLWIFRINGPSEWRLMSILYQRMSWDRFYLYIKRMSK